MKFQMQIICLSLMLALSSCDYSPDSFPDKLIADYELAIPIADTTLSLADIAFPPELSWLPNESTIIPPGKIGPWQISYPFYMSDFTKEGHIIEWVEPKAIFDNTIFDKIDFFASFHIESEQGEIFPLSPEVKMISGKNVLFGNAASRINYSDFASLDGANRLYINLTMNVKDGVTLKDFKESKAHMKFGIKAKFKMRFSI